MTAIAGAIGPEFQGKVVSVGRHGVRELRITIRGEIMPDSFLPGDEVMVARVDDKESA